MAKQDDDGRLHELARAIDEGTAIDWIATESGAPDDDTRHAIRELAVIAAISHVHSSPAPEETVSAPLDGSGSPSAPAAWGAFRLLEKVGEGAYGEVYRAWDTRLDREVALKLLRAESLDETARATAIIEEGRLLARVRHPNVVTIYGAERVENRLGLWMEFVRGRTLEQILEAQDVLSSSEAITIGLDVCRAVSAVHNAGLIHRDIKAQNVMRSEDGRIALMDFGAGRTLTDEAPVDLAGTPLYLAPEVLNGQPATIQSDLYSLGVLIYHLVTGSYPVKGRTVREIRGAHDRGERTVVRHARHDVSRKLADVIERAIDPSPDRRYGGAEAMAADLAALAPRPALSRGALAAGATIAALLIVGVSWEMLGRLRGHSTPLSALLTASTGAAIDRPVIAVMPFRNLSADGDDVYFADGVTDEVIRSLASVRGLHVLASTSSFAFRKEPRNLREIEERTGANLILEGSVSRAGGRLRIDTRLIRVAGNVPLWFEHFDRQFSDIFAIQDEISQAIAMALELRSENRPARRQPRLETYDAYLRGRALVARRGIPNQQRAVELFKHAIASDPDFAPAHAGLANAYAFMSFPYRGISFDAAYPVMREAAAKALSLDPSLPEAHAAMGWVYAFERDWSNAHTSFQESLRLNPSLTQTYTSYSLSTLQPLQKYDDALRLLQTARQYDPLSLDVLREIGEVQLFSGRYAEAIATLEGVIAIQPDYPFVQTYLAKALAFAGRAEEALPRLEMVEVTSPWLAHIYVVTGRRADAEKLANDMTDYPYRLAVTSAALGDTPRAIEALERAAASEPHRVGRLLIEPELAAVRNPPQAVAVRKAFNLP